MRWSTANSRRRRRYLRVFKMFRELREYLDRSGERLCAYQQVIEFMESDVKPTGGTFTIFAYGLQSKPLPFDVTPAMVNAAIEENRQRAKREACL